MSNYDDLMKKVILEAIEKQRLDEKEAIKVDLGSPNVMSLKPSGAEEMTNDKEDLFKYEPYKGGEEAEVKPDVYDATKNVADNTKAKKDLRDKDFIDAGLKYKDNPAELDNIAALKKHFGQKAKQDADTLVKFGKDLRDGMDNLDTDARAEAFTFVTSVMQDDQTQSVEDFLEKLRADPKLGEYFKNLTAGGDVTNVFGQTDVLSQVQTISRFKKEIRYWVMNRNNRFFCPITASSFFF